MEQMVRQRIERIDNELEQLKQKGLEADRVRSHQNAIEDMRKKTTKKKNDKTAKRKAKVQQEGMTQKEQDAALISQRK